MATKAPGDARKGQLIRADRSDRHDDSEGYGGIGATTSLAGRIGANTGQYGIHCLQAFYMLCTAIAVRTCSTWYGVIAINTRHQFDEVFYCEYFNGWLTAADRSSNAGQRAHSAHNLKALTLTSQFSPPTHPSMTAPVDLRCLYV